MPLTQAQRDARRDSTFVRIGKKLLSQLRKYATKNKTTVRSAMETILRERFAKATEQGGR